VNTFPSLVRNELVKTWRSRWIVFAALFGLFALIVGGLYIYYVVSQHRATPPPAVAWQTLTQQDIAAKQAEVAALQQLGPGSGSGEKGGIRSGVIGGGSGLGTAIARDQTAITNDQYLLANDIAPVNSYSITGATLFGLGGIIMFLLTRIFGWLASEQVAGERSDRTLTILLSRPVSRVRLLAAKAISSFLISLVVVVITFLIVYALYAFFLGSAGPITGQVGIALDSTKALGPGNLAVMQIPVFVLMCLGATMLAIVCVQGMSLLVSVVSGRWAAIGITLALLFGAPIVSGIVRVVITLISGSPDTANFMNYLFFNVLAPVGSIATVIGGNSTAGTMGMNEFWREVATLGAWAIAFYVGAWLLFRHKQEAG
jgi:ABC-type transport system involved in multi-copper enzyme maturation permease subunit